MRVVGLDMSLRAPGVCLIALNGNAKTFLITGIPGEKRPRWERFRYICKSVMAEIVATDTVFIEDYAFAAHSSSDTVLKELGGLIRMLMWKRTGVFPVTIGTAALKKWVTGKGNFKKNMMLKEVFKKYGKDFNDDNLADAYSIADLGINFLGCGRPNLTKIEQEIIKKIKDSLHPEHLQQLHNRANQFREIQNKS